MNFLSLIEENLSPDDIAVIEAGREICYGELLAASTAISDQVIDHFPYPADTRLRIALSCDDGIDYIITALAILRLDACLIPVPKELATPEITELLNSTAAHAHIIAVPDSPESHLDHPALATSFHCLPLTPPPPQFPEAEFDQLNPSFIRFSSGTTGSSKGVVISHQTLADRTTAANEGLQITRNDRVLWVLSMAHHFAVSIMLYLRAGATTVIEPSPLGEDIYKAAEDHHCTVLYGSPYHYRTISEYTEAKPLPDLRLAIVTAAASNAELAANFEKTIGMPLTQALGIIEVGLPIINLENASDSPTALGQALPSYEIRIADKEGNPLPDGEIGELQIKGPGMFDAYLSPWKLASDTLLDGFFQSGDLASRTSATIHMHGRSKSVINVGGMKVFPEEVESVLNSHPAISLSRVTAQHHPLFGSYPIAELIAVTKDHPPLRDLKQWCEARLSTHKHPKRFLWVEDIPLTLSGKICRDNPEPTNAS